MSARSEVKFRLKVMINKDKTKVLFAEVDSDFVDVLSSFLTLPLGTILRIFENHYGGKDVPVVGSLNSLRKGLADLDDLHFWTSEGKMMLLNPVRSSEDECRKLKLNIDHHAQPIKYFTCEDLDCGLRGLSDVRMYSDTSRCACGRPRNRELRETNNQAANNENGGIFKKTLSFVISDDLQIAPSVTGSVIQNIRNFGITDIEGAKQMTVTLGLNAIMDLLKGSLDWNCPLTNLILKKTCMAPLNLEPNTVMHKMEVQSNVKKIVIKAIIQKTTKKFLFAIANEKFIDFLFSLLTIPLGGVVNLLDINTPFRSINNLYCSIQNMDDECLKTKDSTKRMLLKTELASMYGYKNQILPLVEQKPPLWYLTRSTDDDNKCHIRSSKRCKTDPIVTFNDPKGEGSYLKGPGMFMVTDDLTVTPLSMLSTISTLNGLKIPLSDVKEREIEIGFEEALDILRASLITSTSVLTNGLMINYIVTKKQKEQ